VQQQEEEKIGLIVLLALAQVCGDVGQKVVLIDLVLVV